MLASWRTEDNWRAEVTDRYRCPEVADSAVKQSSATVPRLMRAYLGLGDRISGGPALDAEFNTIDFLTLLDVEWQSPRRARSKFWDRA